MLFVTLARAKPGSTVRERMARRLDWSFPEGARIVAEYWLQTEDPTVVMAVEADSMAPIMAAIAQWDDVLDIQVFPAVTAEEGMQLARRMQEQMAEPA